MSIPDLLAALFSLKGVTKIRVQKAQGAAARVKVQWSDVLAAMTDEQRAQVEHA